MLPCILGLSMLLISSIGIEIVKHVTVDHVKRMTSFCQLSSKHVFIFFFHMLWYAPAKFVMLEFCALLMAQNCNQWPRNNIKCSLRRHNNDVTLCIFAKNLQNHINCVSTAIMFVTFRLCNSGNNNNNTNNNLSLMNSVFLGTYCYWFPIKYKKWWERSTCQLHYNNNYHFANNDR